MQHSMATVEDSDSGQDERKTQWKKHPRRIVYPPHAGLFKSGENSSPSNKRIDEEKADNRSCTYATDEETLQQLDEKTQNVEQQIKYLTKCVDRLAQDLADEQTDCRLLKSHVDDAYSRLEQSKRGDAEREKAFQKMYPVSLTEENIDLRPEVLLAQNRQLLQLLQEEKLSKAELRAQYEKQLNFLRRSTEQGRIDERRKVLQEFDFVIKKYHGLAVEAARLARSEREKMKSEKARVQRVAESACKLFEREIKDRTRRALDEYRKLAQEAHTAARRERAELLQHCSKMESAIDRERRNFEAQVVREAERRVAGYRSALEENEEEAKRERQRSQKRINELCDQIEQKCRDFERTLRSKILQVLWEHGVDMEEEELIRLLDEAEGVPLRSTVPERARAEVSDAPEEKVMEHPQRNYGFLLLPKTVLHLSDATTSGRPADSPSRDSDADDGSETADKHSASEADQTLVAPQVKVLPPKKLLAKGSSLSKKTGV